jgi:hypothetical protein
VTEGPARRRSVVPLLLVPAAIIVTATLLLLRLRMEPPTVPSYSLTGGETDAGAVVLRAGERFRLAVEPGGIVTGAVGARGFLLRGDEVQAWDPPFTVDRDGSIHLDGPVETLFAGIAPGPWEVAVAVGRPETLPTAPRDVLRARDAGAGDAAWHLVREHVVLGG